MDIRKFMKPVDSSRSVNSTCSSRATELECNVALNSSDCTSTSSLSEPPTGDASAAVSIIDGDDQVSLDSDSDSEQPSITKRYKRACKAEYLEAYGVVDVQGEAHCVLCHQRIPNESLKPNKLVRHLTKKHGDVLKQSEDAKRAMFKAKAAELSGEQTSMRKCTVGNDQLSLMSMHIAWLLAKAKKPFTDAEVLILPSLILFCTIMLPQVTNAIALASSIPLSDNTMQKRTCILGDNIEKQLYADLARCTYYSLALDESTDITGVPVLSVFVRFDSQKAIREELLDIALLRGTTTGCDIYESLMTILRKAELPLSK